MWRHFCCWWWRGYPRKSHLHEAAYEDWLVPYFLARFVPPHNLLGDNDPFRSVWEVLIDRVGSEYLGLRRRWDELNAELRPILYDLFDP